MNCLCVSLEGITTPPVLVKAEVTPIPKDVLVKKAVPTHFPLLERVKGKSSEQLKALEESFQRSSTPTEADIGKDLVQDDSSFDYIIHCRSGKKREDTQRVSVVSGRFLKEEEYCCMKLLTPLF